MIVRIVFSIVVECGRGALIGNTVKTAPNEGPEVAPRESAVAQIYGPKTSTIIGVIFLIVVEYGRGSLINGTS